MPKVSVIVPVFEPGRLIEPLIATLRHQTMPAAERELIFVDDGSRDGTAERLDALAREQPGVRALHIPNSGWPGRPRNVGLDAAEGEFVFFADHDDWLAPDALRAPVRHRHRAPRRHRDRQGRRARRPARAAPQSPSTATASPRPTRRSGS